MYKGKEDTFDEIGRLTHRILVQNIPTQTNIAPLDRTTILHILAIQPAAISNIASRAKIDADKVGFVMKQFGISPDSHTGLYSLPKPALARINPNWPGYTQQERLTVQLATKAWQSGVKSASAAKNNSITRRSGTPVENITRRAGTPVDGMVRHPGTPVDLRAATPVETSSPKRPREDHADLIQLAKKFKHQYSEYAKLYTAVKTQQSGDQLQRLLSLHKRLSAWKQRLWAQANKTVEPQTRKVR